MHAGRFEGGAPESFPALSNHETLAYEQGSEEQRARFQPPVDQLIS